MAVMVVMGTIEAFKSLDFSVAACLNTHQAFGSTQQTVLSDKG